MIWNRTHSPGCAKLAPERRPAPTAACVDDLEPDAFAGLREAGAVTASGCCSSVSHKRERRLLLPPQSAVISSSRASG